MELNNVFFDSEKVEISFCIAKSFQEENKNNKLEKTVLYISFTLTFLNNFNGNWGKDLH